MRKKMKTCGEREILRWEKKKKDRHGREETNEKNSANFSNFPATQLLTSITSTKFDVK